MMSMLKAEQFITFVTKVMVNSVKFAFTFATKI